MSGGPTNWEWLLADYDAACNAFARERDIGNVPWWQTVPTFHEWIATETPEYRAAHSYDHQAGAA